jgi:predicted RNA-binding Zn-ribbon protein involved in translation (DUF1610 family)
LNIQMAKKNTTFSSPRSVSSTESPWTKKDKEGIYSCPECGEREVRWVVGDCRLLDGTLVPNLERLQCSSCGENLFDLEAMRRIREVRESLRTKRIGRHKPTRKTPEPKNA